jgi:predicted ATP-dependent serine protease
VKRIKPFIQFINELKSDRVMSANDLLNQDYKDNLQFEGKWKDIFNSIAPDFTMMVTGAPGSGKTSFLLEFAYYLASNFGKVLYISSEEYGSVTLADKLEKIIKEKGLHKTSDDGTEKSLIPKNLFFGKGFTDLQDYDFIVLDSVNDMNLDLMNFKEVRDIYSDKGFILVLQYTKAGDYRGGKDWEHECDVALDMKEGYIQTFKNRYGKKVCYDYFNDKVIECDKTNDNEKL